jgi:ADP-ribosylglycohydrolase
MRRIAIFGALALAVLLSSVLAGTAAARALEPFARGRPTETLEAGTAAKLNHNPAARTLRLARLRSSARVIGTGWD